MPLWRALDIVSAGTSTYIVAREKIWGQAGWYRYVPGALPSFPIEQLEFDAALGIDSGDHRRKRGVELVFQL